MYCSQTGCSKKSTRICREGGYARTVCAKHFDEDAWRQRKLEATPGRVARTNFCLFGVLGLVNLGSSFFLGTTALYIGLGCVALAILIMLATPIYVHANRWISAGDKADEIREIKTNEVSRTAGAVSVAKQVDIDQ